MSQYTLSFDSEKLNEILNTSLNIVVDTNPSINAKHDKRKVELLYKMLINSELAIKLSPAYSFTFTTFRQNVFNRVRTEKARKRNNGKITINENLLAILQAFVKAPEPRLPKASRPAMRITKSQPAEINKLYFGAIRDSFNITRAKENEGRSPADYVAFKNKITTSRLLHFLSAHPPLIHNLLDEKLTNGLPQLPKDFKSEETLKTIKVFTLFQTLHVKATPIAILSEIGRLMRFARIFNSTPKILCTDRDIAKLNWLIVGNSHDAIVNTNIEDELQLNKTLLLALYKKLGVEFEMYNFEDITIENETGSEIHYADITKNARRHYEFVKQKLGKSGPENLSNETARKSQIEALEGFSEANHPDKQDSLPDLRFNVAKKIMTSLSSYSENSFRYFFFQYYHQHKFEKALKLSSVKEFSMDQGFKSFEQTQTKVSNRLLNLYFEENILAKNIYLADGENQDKLTQILADTQPDSSLFGLISDLLSFAHYFFVSNQSDSLSGFDDGFAALLAAPELKELKDSWVAYTKTSKSFDDNLRNFEARILTYWDQSCIIPYWHFPYFLHQLRPDVFRDFSGKFISLLLRCFAAEFRS